MQVILLLIAIGREALSLPFYSVGCGLSLQNRSGSHLVRMLQPSPLLWPQPVFDMCLSFKASLAGLRCAWSTVLSISNFPGLLRFI
jgi:hypothetical protein